MEDRDTFYRVFHEVFELIGKGILRAPRGGVAYSISQVGDAFRFMQQGKHCGKIVLSFGDGAKASVLRKAKVSMKLDPSATYLIVGGLGGLGRSLAKEFVASGARNIAFLSRSGDSTPAAKAILDELTASEGVKTKAYRGDVGNKASFIAAMAKCEQELLPVKGVVQMAIVLRDIVFKKMSYSK